MELWPNKVNKEKYENYLIINSDIVTNLNYKNLVFMKVKIQIFGMSKSFENKIEFGVLDISKNKIKGIKEKPIIHYDFCCGIYVLKKKVLKEIRKNKKIDMPQLIEQCSKKKINIIPYMIHEYWKDIGTKENLLELNQFYSKYFI